MSARRIHQLPRVGARAQAGINTAHVALWGYRLDELGVPQMLYALRLRELMDRAGLPSSHLAMLRLDVSGAREPLLLELAGGQFSPWQGRR